eukprot:GFUD01000777.1.p1 GENE.GFUD01000777.1~~GFUD01000777.1.p1  ORF type:complete len:178 (-),score=65.71 GFUD01000777.1:92-625(-)
MSFPRVVPIAKRKVDYKVRNRIMGASMLYTVGFYGVGEYFGWWDKYILDRENSSPEGIVKKVQEDDEKMWTKWSMKMLNTTVEKSRRIVNDQFLENMPLGMKHHVNDPRLQMGYNPDQHPGVPPHLPAGPDQPGYVQVYEGAPGSAPTLVRREDLITYTSSKSSQGGAGGETAITNS